jgi:hypothetical protein
MEKLDAGEWILLSRYFAAEATDEELTKIERLLKENPLVRSTLQKLTDNDHHASFLADNAFAKLDQRLKDEGLI